MARKVVCSRRRTLLRYVITGLAIALSCAACRRSDDLHGRTGAALNDIHGLDSALEAYLKEYGIKRLAKRHHTTNRDVYRGLTIQGSTEFIDEINLKRLRFLDRKILQESPDGELLDPWGNPYQVAIKNPEERSITVGDTQIPRDYAIWSHGRNGRNESGSGDDIASWNLRRDQRNPLKVWIKEQRYRGGQMTSGD